MVHLIQNDVKIPKYVWLNLRDGKSRVALRLTNLPSGIQCYMKDGSGWYVTFKHVNGKMISVSPKNGSTIQGLSGLELTPASKKSWELGNSKRQNFIVAV